MRASPARFGKTIPCVETYLAFGVASTSDSSRRITPTQLYISTKSAGSEFPSAREEIDRRFQFRADNIQACFVGNFHAELVLDVEHVDSRALFRGNLGKADI